MTYAVALWLSIGAVIAARVLVYPGVSKALPLASDKAVAFWIMAMAWPVLLIMCWGLAHPAAFRRFIKKGQR